MIHFPIVCVDDFYDDPDSVRNFALSQEFYHTDDGRWPGKRTKHLSELSSELHEKFCLKLFSIYFDFDSSGAEWEISTGFQLIESLHEDPLSPKNMGWIHHDTQAVFGGIIYLNPDIDEDCGTDIYKLKNERDRELSYDKKYLNTKTKFYKDSVDENYDNIIVQHKNLFEKTASFKNIYNRMVSFDGTTFHGVNSFYSINEPRLTQFFFVEKLVSTCLTPLERVRGI